MTEEQHGFSVSLSLIENYMFQIDFGDFGQLISDEPEPLGHGDGPNPVRLLAASIANCLAASLLFSIKKYKEDPGEISAVALGSLERVDKRWRLKKLQVDIVLGNAAADIGHLQNALDQFEDFCVVTQSVRSGISVDVTVTDGHGDRVKL